eukprot:m51a1_g12162 hypothetical protein (207) ;mRNA; f:11849-12469
MSIFSPTTSPQPDLREGDKVNYEDFRVAFARNFDFGKLERLFDSFMANGARDIPAAPPDPAVPRYVIFEYEGSKWRATIESNQYRTALGEERKCLTIRLPNDSFFYPMQSELNVFQSTVGRRHHSDGWVLLDRSEPSRLLPTITTFMETYTGAGAGRVKMFYNSSHRSLDVKVFNKAGTEITVVFHHGDPESPFEEFEFEAEPKAQ